MAIIQAGRDGVSAVGFAPAVIDMTNEPVAAEPNSDEGRRVLAYLAECCASQGLRTRFAEPDSDSGLRPTPARR